MTVIALTKTIKQQSAIGEAAKKVTSQFVAIFSESSL